MLINFFLCAARARKGRFKIFAALRAPTKTSSKFSQRCTRANKETVNNFPALRAPTKTNSKNFAALRAPTKRQIQNVPCAKRQNFLLLFLLFLLLLCVGLVLFPFPVLGDPRIFLRPFCVHWCMGWFQSVFDKAFDSKWVCFGSVGFSNFYCRSTGYLLGLGADE